MYLFGVTAIIIQGETAKKSYKMLISLKKKKKSFLEEIKAEPIVTIIAFYFFIIKLEKKLPILIFLMFRHTTNI